MYVKCPECGNEFQCILTSRECEIVMLLAKGMSNEEISKTAFITLSTVKNHLRNIFLKLGVTNRVSLLRKAIKLGIVSINDLNDEVVDDV